MLKVSFQDDSGRSLVLNSERPEFQALEQLEETVSLVNAELAVWRRRAQKAETGSPGRGDGDPAAGGHQRSLALEKENKQLKSRLRLARSRVSELLMRLRFLEEQAAERTRT